MIVKKLLSNKKRIIKSSILLLLVLMILYFSVFNVEDIRETSNSTVFLDRNGKPLRTILSSNEKYNRYCSLSEVSPHFLRAIVLVEDRSFYSHWGVSLPSVIRALFQNIRERKIKSGASTITMQYAKLIKKNGKRNIFNKILETFYALKLELHLNKSEILEGYINRLPFGNLIYGINAASRYYFGKNPKELSLNQSIYLALIPKSPSYYNPIKHLKRLKKRKNMILREFKRKNYITEDEFIRISKEGIRFNIAKKNFIAPHFIRRLLKEKKGVELKSRIITTLDKEIQLNIRGILIEALERLKPYNIKSGAIVVIDNNTRGVLAYVGSPNYFNIDNDGSVDYANSLRQPGSTLKPFIYAMALERGYTSSTIIPDVRFPTRGGFFPSNYDGKEHGPLRLRTALGNSFNIPAFYLAMKLKPKNIIEKLQEIGFTYLNKTSGFYGETIALGAGEVKLYDLVKAYSLFAHRGIMFEPSMIAREGKARKRRIFEDGTAYTIWNILSDSGARAISFGYKSAMNLPFPLAIKTGTSKGFRDKWAVGVNSEYTIGVWLGNPSGENMKDLTGVANATSILRDVFLLVQRDWNRGEVEQPKGIVKMKICTLSGEIATENCKNTKEEIYFKTVPKRECSYHILNEGRIITVFPELYRDWARKNNYIKDIKILKNNVRKISFPQQHDFFHIAKAIPIEAQTIKFKVMGFSTGDKIEYYLNDRLYIKRAYPNFPEWQLKRGDFTLKIIFKEKEIDKVAFLVR